MGDVDEYVWLYLSDEVVVENTSLVQSVAKLGLTHLPAADGHLSVKARQSVRFRELSHLWVW